MYYVATGKPGHPICTRYMQLTLHMVPKVQSQLECLVGPAHVKPVCIHVKCQVYGNYSGKLLESYQESETLR
jgi:hypothetical protein